MTIDRRSFLRLSANTTVATAAFAGLPASIRKALAVPAAVETGTIKDVKHVVMLMQENRGFDHYFGTMKGVRGFGDRFPVPLASGKPVWHQSNGTTEVAPFHLDPSKFNALLAPSTPHAFSDSQAAWNQGKFGHWAKYKNDNSMGYYTREDIPFQFALAESFTICDAYHCSITTGTDPNRITFWSGSNFNPELAAKGINCTDADSEPNNLRCWIANPGRQVAGAGLYLQRFGVHLADHPRRPRAGRHHLAHLPGPQRQLDRRHARLPGVRELQDRTARIADLPQRHVAVDARGPRQRRPQRHVAASVLGAAAAGVLGTPGCPVEPDERRQLHRAGAGRAHRQQ